MSGPQSDASAAAAEQASRSIRYRTFRNQDPPQLAEIWRARARERGLMHPMSAELFEQLVLAKPYFDKEGLIVALDGDVAVGFVHAAFGPTEDEGGLSTSFGVTAMLMVRPDYRRLGIGRQLLTRSEAYLHRHGAQVLYGGGIYPLNAFYLGLYGGSELPGVLDFDVEAQRLYQAAGYQEIDHCLVLHRELKSFRPLISREQLAVRRVTTLRETADPASHTWWEACTVGAFERTRHELVANASQQVLAGATTWNMEPLSASWGVRTVGLIDVAVEPEHRRRGLATYLLGEIFRRLQQTGVALVETQTMQREHGAAVAFYERLGFKQVDRGAVYRKS
jgi:ribosomal protein S18 acetylase RimI-like enzyme